MRFYLSVLFILATCFAKAQPDTKANSNTFEWDGIYELQLSDFQSPSTEIGDDSMISLNADGHLGFSFYMSNAEFMFTKNFNEKVSCTFNRSAAAIVAPDSAFALMLVNLERCNFDMGELYARKFRQQLYLNKGAFSNVSFFQPIFDRIQREYHERHTRISKETRMGANQERLAELHTQVKAELKELADFCKTCKPPKRKKE